MKHFSRESVLNRAANGNTLTIDDREPDHEHCACCGGEVSNKEKFCGDCLYDLGRE